MGKRIVYIVQFSYVDYNYIYDCDFRTLAYNSYDEALEKLEQYKRIQLEACELNNTGYDIIADYDNIFKIYMNNETMLEVKIHIHELDELTENEKKLGKEIGVYEKLK